MDETSDLSYAKLEVDNDLDTDLHAGVLPLEASYHSDDILWFHNTSLPSDDEMKYEGINLACLTASSSSDGSTSANRLSSSQLDSGETEWLKTENLELKNISASDEPIKNIFNAGRRYSLGDSNSKNAIAARDNRLRKKKYLAGLEECVRNLRAENEHLQEQCKQNNSTVSRLQNEITYLRGVIANQSTISAVLENVMKTPGVQFSMSLTGTKQNCAQTKMTQAANDRLSHDYKLSQAANDRLSHDYKVSQAANNDRLNFDKPKCCVGQSSVHLPPDLVNSLLPSSKKKASRFPRKNSKFKSNRKKMQESQRMKIAQDYEETESIDVENCDDSDSSVAAGEVAGVCLHVLGQNVSLEFCSHCSASARAGVKSEHSYVKL